MQYEYPKYIEKEDSHIYLQNRHASLLEICHLVRQFVHDNPMYGQDLISARHRMSYVIVNDEVFIPSQFYPIVDGINKTGFYVNPVTKHVRFLKDNGNYAYPIFGGNIIFDIPKDMLSK